MPELLPARRYLRTAVAYLENAQPVPPDVVAAMPDLVARLREVMLDIGKLIEREEN